MINRRKIQLSIWIGTVLSLLVQFTGPMQDCLCADVQLELKNNKRITAREIHPVENSDVLLELKTSRHGLHISRKIPLEQITRIWIDGEPWQPADLRLLLQNQSSQMVRLMSLPVETPDDHPAGTPTATASGDASVLPPLPLPLEQPVYITTPVNQPDAFFLHLPRPALLHHVDLIDIQARPVHHWGRADWDALRVEISAFDRMGSIVPFRGTANITLWGSSQRLVRGFGPQLISVNEGVKVIGRWSRFVESDVISPLPHLQPASQPVIFELLLSRPLAEQDLQKSPSGLLQLELSVPGQGLFYAGSPVIPLAQRNHVRDQLLLETGSRFFNREATTGRLNRTNAGFRTWTSIRPASPIYNGQP